MGAVAELLAEIRSWRKAASVPRRQLLRDRDPGKEVPDPVPLEMPVGYETPPTMEEMIQQYVRQELSVQAQEQGFGTFEEEDDFEIEDPEEISMSGFEVDEFAMTDEEAIEDASPPSAAPEASEEPSAAPAEPSVENPGDEPRGTG